MYAELTLYRELGWTAFPLVKRGKRPPRDVKWKSLQTIAPDDDQAAHYARKIERNDLNVGLVTGKLSNLFVVDFDYAHGGAETLKNLCDDGIIDLLVSPNVDTPHGKHVYFAFPDIELRNTAARLPGLDTRGEGGYVVAPPSKLDDGEYKWFTPLTEPLDLPAVPQVLVEMLNKPAVVAATGSTDYAPLLEGVCEGGRNNSAAILAGHFFNKGLSADVVLTILTDWNERNDPPLSNEELQSVVGNIKGKEIEKRTDNHPSTIQFDVPNIPIVSDYVALASEAIPAPSSYHVLCCLSLLSTLLSENVALSLKSDWLYPNLYIMLLADTTWTYKTTSMKRALALLDKVYPEAVIGSGGSPEGLFYALSERQGISSLFFRDEAVGFFYEAGQKNYMSGMLDSLTKFYDCQSERRVLAGDQRQGQTTRTVHIRDPRLSLMAGGTLTRFFDVIDEDKIMDGFLPRFLFSVREGNATNLKPLEMADNQYTRDSDILLQNIMGLYLKGKRQLTTTQPVLDMHHEYMVELVTSELSRYGGRDFGGVYNRLAISVLKVAMILACAEGKQTVRVTKKHLQNAILLAQEWKQSLDFIIKTVGKPSKERMYDKVLGYLQDCGGTASRSSLMKLFHLESREMTRIIDTLLDREQIACNGKLVSLHD
jgi:hypothetical protein